MTSPKYDAIIIGSGASGSFAAKELTAQGLNVLLLEAGREITPADFDPASKPKRVPPINIMERALATFGGQSVQSKAAFFRGMLGKFYVNDRHNPYTTPSDAPFVWIRGRQAGGRTHTFGRVLLRWTDDDFKAQSRTGKGVDWPISYADLEPFYDEVEEFLGLYGNTDGVSTLPDGKYTGSAKLSPAEQDFKRTVESKWPERHVVAWRSLAPSPSRVLRPLEEAKRSGRLTIRFNSIARRVVTEGGKATGVEIIDAITHEHSVVDAAHVIVCASPIESVRLLLNSASGDHPGGIGNSSGQLGRYFMDQIPMLGLGIYPKVKGGWNGDDSQPADPFYDASGGIFIPRFENTGSSAPRADYDYQGAIGRGGSSDDPASLLFFGFGLMQPHAENRVTLNPSRKDRWRIPAPHIRCKIQPEDAALLERQEAAFVETINGAGGQVEFLGSPRGIREWGRGAYPDADPVSRFLFKRFFKQVMVMGAAIHETGGARMGTSPETSVLNQWGQVWDVPNIYVTDASAFAGSGVTGTTLTIMAQTVRACRHLAHETTGRP